MQIKIESAEALIIRYSSVIEKFEAKTGDGTLYYREGYKALRCMLMVAAHSFQTGV